MPSPVAYPRSLTGIALAGVLCLGTAAVSAQDVPSSASGTSAADRPAIARVVRPVAGSGAIRSRAVSIHGGAWHADNTPVPGARLRLRNVITGRIEATAVANENGEFAFTGIAAGTYLIEMVAEHGKVLAVGHTFTVAPGETIATFVRLGPKVRWFNGLFGNASLMVAASAATVGVMAVSPETITPISPNR